MKSEDFKNWRKEMGFNQEQAANALDKSRRQIIKYENGDVEISRETALACAAIKAGLKPYGD